MDGKIISKRYYKIEFRLASALSIGGNASYTTDKDIVYNGKGVPYIPATSLTGVYRSFFDDEKANNYFGNSGLNNFTESKIYVYDAEMKNDDYTVSRRDCVGLDEWKTSIKGAKFDFEIIEPEAEFVTYIEQDIYETTVGDKTTVDENVADFLADMWCENKIRIGGKTARGLGGVKNVSVKMKSFSFKDDDEKSKWLDFDIFDDNDWSDSIVWNGVNDDKQHWEYSLKDDKIILKLSMKQDSPITVRTYTTDVSGADYRQLTLKKYFINGKKEENVAVIPGTSWAGAFRHHIEKLGICKNDDTKGVNVIDDVFGYCSEGKSKKSSIYFSESIIHGGDSKTFSRNSIDRFTGGTVENALFTEEVYYGGETTLQIEFDRPRSAEFLKSMAMAVADLHGGFISVGGETSIGHGIFRLKSIKCNDKDIVVTDNLEELYENVVSKLFEEKR